MRNVTVVVGALVSVVVLFSPVVDAWAVPPDVSYQGQLLDASGAPLTGTVSIEVRVYPNKDLTEGETPLFVEDHENVPVTNGVFQVLLGRGTASLGEMNAELFANDERYLEVHVNGERIEPRQAMSSVPYSFQAENVSGFTAAQLLGPHLFDVHGNDLGMVLFRGGDFKSTVYVYNTSLQLLYWIKVTEVCSFPDPGEPPESRFGLGTHWELSFPLDPRYYTEPDCEGQAYVDLGGSAGSLFALPAATIVSDGAWCTEGSVSLTRLDLDQLKLCPELVFLSARVAGNCEAIMPQEPPLPGGPCDGAMTPNQAVPITPFDPADLGFPYPIEGPLRMGLTP